MTLLEQFEVISQTARPVAHASDGSVLAYENSFKKGSTIAFGSFVGQENYHEPVEGHPLAGILAKWSGLSAAMLKAPSLIELRQMYSSAGRFVFLFNHGEKPAQIEFTRTLEKPAAAIHEISTGRAERPTGPSLAIKTEVPPQSVRIYRIDY